MSQRDGAFFRAKRRLVREKERAAGGLRIVL